MKNKTYGDLVRQANNKKLADLFAVAIACKRCPMIVECAKECKTYMRYRRSYSRWLNEPIESEDKEQEQSR